MKIIANIPCWKRPEVVRFMIRYLPKWVEPVFCVSEEDPHFGELVALIKLYGYDVVSYPNDALGAKNNALIRYIWENYKFDYLIHLGSDDLVNPNLLELYKPFFEQKAPFFGISDCFFWDFNNKKDVFYLKKYNDNHAIGGGRCISWDLINLFMVKGFDFYTPAQPCGLDNNSRLRVQEFTGVSDQVAETNDVPYILDLKTNTNINPLEMFGSSLKERFKKMDISQVINFFEERIPASVVKKLNDNDQFFETFYELNQYFKSNKDTFDWLNLVHTEIFGTQKFSSYDSFRKHKNFFDHKK